MSGAGCEGTKLGYTFILQAFLPTEQDSRFRGRSGRPFVAIGLSHVSISLLHWRWTAQLHQPSHQSLRSSRRLICFCFFLLGGEWLKGMAEGLTPNPKTTRKMRDWWSLCLLPSLVPDDANRKTWPLEKTDVFLENSFIIRVLLG